MIEHYFNSTDHGFNINYFIEKKPLGTAGSLSLMTGELKSTFFISQL